MAIIKCPACSEQISDKVKQCPHCDMSMTAQTREQQESAKRVERIKTIQSIQTQTMLALMISIGGFVFYYLDDPIGDIEMQKTIGIVGILLGLIVYLVNRIRIAFINKKFKSER